MGRDCCRSWLGRRRGLEGRGWSGVCLSGMSRVSNFIKLLGPGRWMSGWVCAWMMRRWIRWLEIRLVVSLSRSKVDFQTSGSRSSDLTVIEKRRRGSLHFIQSNEFGAPKKTKKTKTKTKQRPKSKKRKLSDYSPSHILNDHSQKPEIHYNANRPKKKKFPSDEFRTPSLLQR